MTTTTQPTTNSLTQLRTLGHCLLPDVIPPDLAHQLRYSLYGIGISCGVIAQSYNPNIPWIPFYTRVSVIKDVPGFSPYLTTGPAADLLHTLLGPTYSATATTMLIHEPGTTPGPFTRSDPFDSTTQSLPPTGDATHLTAIFMFSPFTKENGGLRIIPTSHTTPTPLSTDTSPRTDETTITGRLGSIALLDSRLLRAIAPNDSDVPRLSVHVGLTSSQPRGFRGRDAASVLTPAAYARIPASAQTLFAHWTT